MSTRSTLLTSTIVLCFTGCLSAQSALSEVTLGALSPGDRIEITTNDGRRLKGKVEAADGTTVSVVNASHRGLFRVEEIAAIELQKDSLWNGAIYGLAAGMVAGALAVDTTRNDNPFCGMGFWDDCGGDSRMGGMVIGGGLGALLGAGIDALIFKRDRTIFRRTPRVLLVPSVGVRMRHVAVSVTWR